MLCYLQPLAILTDIPTIPSLPPCSITLVTTLHFSHIDELVFSKGTLLSHVSLPGSSSTFYLNALSLLLSFGLLLTFHLMMFYFTKFLLWKLSFQSPVSFHQLLSFFVHPLQSKQDRPSLLFCTFRPRWFLSVAQTHCNPPYLRATLEGIVDAYPYCFLASNVLPKHFCMTGCLLPLRF